MNFGADGPFRVWRAGRNARIDLLGGTDLVGQGHDFVTALRMHDHTNAGII